MRSSKKQAKQITSTIMAIVMAATTTFQMPVIAMADETMSTVAVESQIEEVTEESSDVSVKETDAQTSVKATVADTSEALESDSTEVTQTPEAVVESTAEVICEEEETSLPAEVDPSGEDTKESDANETRGPDEEAAETTQIETEVATEAESEAESTIEIETEGSTEVEKADPFAALDPSTGFTEEALAAIDFSSKRLLVAADPAVIIDPEHVLSSYAGVYLMQYDTEAQAKYAYAYYYGKSEFVDVDTVISVADGDNSANAAAPMAADENPIAELHEAVAGNPVKAAGAVAVIDTGVNGVANVTESVSMIGDNTADENGHGTKMAQLIAEQNPDVSILSIKALGADGTGDVSAVYAAIQYAIDKKVSVINLSMSAVGTAENAALTSIVNEAVAAGIAVVGAAGNNGRDVRFYVPGNIESAYIIGAADKNGERLASSNYGATVDFNVVADSTSEAAAKFSGYYTLNGAVADKKLVFPTDYANEEEIDFDGPNVHHQISYYDYKGSMKDLVWIGQRDAKTILSDDGKYFTTYIGYVEDSAKVKDLDVCVDFMDTYKESIITKDCIVDLENMQVKIPTSYKDSAITVRWYITNASYGYVDDVDAKYMMSDTPEPFKTAKNSNDSITGLNFTKAKQYQQGTYSTAFTHTPASMNHCNVNYSLDSVKEGDYFKIEGGYIAIVDGYNNKRADILAMFGSSALQWYVKNNNKLVPADVTGQTFLTHFGKVTRVGSEEDVSYLFNSISGKGLSTHMINIDTNNDGAVDAQCGADLGWVFGTCAYDFLDGQVPNFEPGGQIICTNKDPDGTTYFFYYCRSTKAQWSGGSFSLTPVLPKNGFLRVHKSSADTKLTNNNSCYTFKNIQYCAYSDSECTKKVATFTLDENGYSDSAELAAGTYYVKETDIGTGTGYKLNTEVYTVEVVAGTTSDAPNTCETTDQPLNDPFGIVINKINSDGTTTADLSGAEYTIKYYAGQYTSVATLPANATYTWIIKTIKDANGYYQAYLDDAHIVSGSAVYGKYNAGTYVIPLGTITVEETKAPAGFTTEGATVKSAKTGASISGTNGVFLFNLVNENSTVYLKSGNALSTEASDGSAMTLTYSEVQNRAGIKVVKYDIAKYGAFYTWDGPQGLASLKGIRFAIINNNGGDVKNSAGTLVPDGGVMQVLTTDDNGYAATGTTDLPTGKYIVKELRKDATVSGTTLNEGTSALANDTYMWADNSADVVLTDSDKNSLKWAPAFYNSPVSAVPKFEKHDLELGKKAPMAGTSMAGITYGIYNDSDHPIKINGTTYKKDEVIQRIVADENGNFTFTTALPYGHYYVKEGGNLHYLESTTKHYFHVICKDGKGAIFYEKKPGGSETDRYDSVFFSNRVIRGNVSLTKKNGETGEAIAYVPFKITNNASGETHYILTNAEGKFNSANGKTVNTNANDAVLSKYKPTDVIPQSVIDSLTKDAGLWFGLGSEGTMTKANSTYGALVYGTYTVTEMKTEATKSMTLLSTTVTINQDGQLVSLGDMNNIPVKISTTLTDDADGDHYAKADSIINLTDVITYKNLPTERTYTIKATLYVKDGSSLTKFTEKTVNFKPSSSNGSTKVLFGNISTKGLAGKSLVCYEELTSGDEFIAEHKNPDDEGQTIHFPTIRTSATAPATGDHIVLADKSTKITDTVTMESLCVGETYKITATLMDKATGNAVKVNGVDVVVNKTFKADKSSMQVPVDFVIDASALAGITTVAFETLSYGTTVIARHEDINDTDQTVYLPSIRTTAKDVESKTDYAAPKENAQITDTVSYTNLIPGKIYKVTGKLMSKTTGQVVTVGGNAVTVTKTFTASDSGSGTVEMTFKFNATGLTGQYVVFETVYYNDVAVAIHEDINDTDQTIMFSKLAVRKLSQDDEYVVGAKLEIRDSKGKVVEAFETKNGEEVFYRLLFDTEYTLVETDAPDGFFVADPIKFMLKENGKVLVDGKEQDALIMVDEYSTGYLEITKQSIISHRLLKNAEYGVYSDEACTTLVTTLVTGDDGTATAELEAGMYWVKELKAPQGYRFDYTVYGPYEIEGRHITESVTLYDKPLTPVPTGIIMTFWPYLAALGVGIVLFIGLKLLKKHNKKKE